MQACTHSPSLTNYRETWDQISLMMIQKDKTVQTQCSASVKSVSMFAIFLLALLETYIRSAFSISDVNE